MFDGQRYITRGANEKLTFELQLLLWSLIDDRKRKKKSLDYLQIFEISSSTMDGKSVVRIIHRQEEPKSKVEHTFYLDVKIGAIKIWAIDSGEYCTMLLPDEY